MKALLPFILKCIVVAIIRILNPNKLQFKSVLNLTQSLTVIKVDWRICPFSVLKKRYEGSRYSATG